MRRLAIPFRQMDYIHTASYIDVLPYIDVADVRCLSLGLTANDAKYCDVICAA